MANTQSACILLVDDDETTNFIHETLLNQIGVTERVLVSTNGRQALDKLQQEKANGNSNPVLILLDLNMPVMNGFEFLEAYQQSEEGLRKAVSIVILTTSLNPKDIDRVKHMGIAGFMNKPLSQEKLKQVIDTHLYNRS